MLGLFNVNAGSSQMTELESLRSFVPAVLVRRIRYQNLYNTLSTITTAIPISESLLLVSSLT